ncbi:polyprenyl synthetase family protein [Halosimplex halophilum]|uniref:hypothetical protein n=1 Tax=Halosimplex halophilum TaxID=2559572 RepID=UPI0014356353|nr:hypothetical protein [Halosimplex halophilum]
MGGSVVSRSAVEARLEAGLSGPDGDAPALAREAVDAADDRWYGRLVGGAYRSLADGPDPDRVVPAAAAVELLRGYCRIRRDLLVQFADRCPHSSTRDEVAALLAGDHLAAAAYSTLTAVDDPAVGDCVGPFADAFEALTGALATTFAEPVGPALDPVASIERTAGRIGECAAVLGGRLAGAGDRRLDGLTRAGRCFAAARAARAARERDGRSAAVAAPELPAERLDDYAARRRTDGYRALGDLPPTVDASPLRRVADDRRED